MTTEEYVELAKKVHGDKYDYSKVNYLNRDTKILLICPEHGEFLQNPRTHLNGSGCKYCTNVKNKKLTLTEFINRAKKVHGDKYDYSKVEYKNSQTKVCIVCPEHGEFLQLPNNHLNGQGCPKCTNKVFDTNDFVKKAKQVHGDKYDYSKVEYENSFKPVTIICKEHGEFKQKPKEHLQGSGCQKCGKIKTWDKRGRITTEEFVDRAKRMHGNKYDYSLTEYLNERSKVCIICHKKSKNGIEHGKFFQKARLHLNGNGCPKCRNSWLESTLRVFFEDKKIKYEQEKTFDWLISNKNYKFHLDFYLPDYNVAIECQGIQHFVALKNNTSKFNEVIKNDLLKKELCDKNNLKIIYFTNKSIFEKYKYDFKLIFDKNELLEEINKCRC